MIRNSSYLFQKSFSALLMLTAFLIPVNPGLVPVAIILTSVFALLSGEIRTNANKVFSSVPAILLILYYLLHIAGLLYTDNARAGKIDLEIKLSLIIFPVLLLFSGKMIIKSIHKIFDFFVAGAFTSMLICLIHAFYLTWTIGGNHFFYKEFSFYMHPGYLAFYYNFATILLYHGFVRKNSIGNEWIFISALFIITVGTILLNSKSGMIVQVMILTYLFLTYKERVGIYFNRIRITSILLIVFLILSGFVIPVSSQRMIGFVDTARNAEDTRAMSHSTQGMRFLAWESSVQAIRESPVFGYGTGDGKDALVGIYSDMNYHDLEELRLNSHNQFLTSWLALGIPSVVMILLCLTTFFIVHLRNTEHVAVAFIVIIIMNMMVESVLEVSAGTIFFSFFFSLFEAMRIYHPKLSNLNTDTMS